MAKLPSQEDAALAFAEVFTTIEFLTAKDKSLVRKPAVPPWIDAPELKDLVAGKVPGREDATSR